MEKFNAEVWFQRVAESNEALTPADIEQFSVIIRHPTVVKALGVAWKNMNLGSQNLFAAAHVGSISGLVDLIQLQGTLRTHAMFIEMLAQIASVSTDSPLTQE